MSWDFWMEVDLGGKANHELDFDASYTSDVAPMYQAAFGKRGIRGLNGLTGYACCDKLNNAIASMERNKEAMLELEPTKGHGNYEEALRLLRVLRGWCIEVPRATMRVD